MHGAKGRRLVVKTLVWPSGEKRRRRALGLTAAAALVCLFGCQPGQLVGSIASDARLGGLTRTADGGPGGLDLNTALSAADAADATGGQSVPAADSAAAGPDAVVHPGTTLSARYPGDRQIETDPAVLFHDDFEAGWGRWDSPQGDTKHLHLERDASAAHSGQRYLRSTVTRQHLEAKRYISAAARYRFSRRVDRVYWRFYARFAGVAPNPHHWVRLAAGDADYNASGLANTVPAGDDGFWFDVDANLNDHFNFYVYWHEMRSGRCNDGSTTPGCAGDQGTTYHYGNVFRPTGQTAFARDAWFCIEISAATNTVGARDGSLALWVDDRLVGRYAMGEPVGTWLRDTFFQDGCSFSACGEPSPFEGFGFRTSAEVGFKSVILDAYYERDTSERRRRALEDRGLTVADAQTILYDDIVVATERIGCQ